MHRGMRLPSPGASWAAWARLLWALMFLAALVIACGAPNDTRAPTRVALTVEIEDHGVTFEIPLGGLVDLRLPADRDWSLDLDSKGFEIVEQDSRPSDVRRWLLRTRAIGTWELRASGAAPCPAGPATCPPPRGFRAAFIVK